MTTLHTSTESDATVELLWTLGGCIIVFIVLFFWALPHVTISSITGCEKKVCRILVNYDKPFDEHIADAHLDWIHPRFTQPHFGEDSAHQTGRQPLDIRFVLFRPNLSENTDNTNDKTKKEPPIISVEKITNAVAKEGFRLVTATELLAIIESGIERNLQGAMIAGGSQWHIPSTTHTAVPMFKRINGHTQMDVVGSGVSGLLTEVWVPMVKINP